jgi:hypothetical protein
LGVQFKRLECGFGDDPKRVAVRHFGNAFETDDAELDSVFALLTVRVEI